ncbi:hypothetical protein A6X20_23990 [Bradyrhizobium elkanii]|nr:hypothetical protein A6X20_23990 [Bradyrhizobium elkanii]
MLHLLATTRSWILPSLRGLARAWNIRFPNTRRKKPGLLAKTGRLKSKLSEGFGLKTEALDAHDQAFSSRERSPEDVMS